MEEIIEKNVEDLKSKCKKIKISLKRTLLGIISATLVFSTLPNIEYKIALYEANHSPYIEEVLATEQTKEEKIAQIFAQAIQGNDNIPDDVKDRVIEAFTTEVINHTGYFFTDKVIKNMYAVASTQKIEQMSDYAIEHGWWDGDYSSYLNTYTLPGTIEDTDLSIIAHEQMHAILKRGMVNTGFTNFIIHGYGINEGTTAIFGKNDESYSIEQNIVDTLGLIIGYDTVFKYFVDSDLRGLKKELNKYISPKETNKLIKNMDLNVFADYLISFLDNNDIPFNEPKLYESYTNRKNEIKDILKKIFKNKNGIPMEESTFGKVILNSSFFKEPLTIYEQLQDNEKINYSITFNNANTVIFNINLDYSYEYQCIINQNFREINVEDTKNYITNKLNVDGVREIGVEALNDTQSLISSGMYYISIPIDEIEEFDYNKVLSHIEKVIETESKSNNDNSFEELKNSEFER